MADESERPFGLRHTEASLQRIARVLLRQVKRGGPSNFEQVAGHYLSPEDLVTFRALVADPVKAQGS